MMKIAASLISVMLIFGATGAVRAQPAAPPATLLHADSFKHYIDYFNRMVDEDVVNHVPNAEAWKWMKDNIPFFECPDKNFEEIYYYRWWTFRKHIKQTPKGFIITEFLKPVKHATEYNAISCALGHHLYEGRWLHDRRYLDQYILFWLRSGEGGGLQPRFHQYSGWTADAVYSRWLVNQDNEYLLGLLDALVLDYQSWETERQLPSGLFWQYDVRDGMEESISGSRKAKNVRPTINSYMYGNAKAIAKIARLAGKAQLATEFEVKAEKLKRLIEERSWDTEAKFFKTLLESGSLADVRELIGFTPWYFNLPDERRSYEQAWKQLMDPKGFYAPYGPTTAERRHPKFTISFEGDDCQWNGPNWPFSTTVTLKALANLLHDYEQKVMSKEDYFNTLKIYTNSHRLRLADGRVIPWIDENLHPFTGEWLARKIKLQEGTFYGRGDHYNHSGYCDLIISGLVGLRPRSDDMVEINPLLPDKVWDWFCLDNVLYHGRRLTILWDKTGKRYGRGKGLRLLVAGKEVARSNNLSRITVRLQ